MDLYDSNIISNGFFVDIGSHNGLASESYILETQYNWQGICIEANPALFDSLKLNRPKSVCINELVWCSNAYVDFEMDNNSNFGRICNIPFNSMYENLSNLKLIKGKTLERIFKDYNIIIPQKIDYIIIDTNGSEIYILEYLLQQYSNISNISIKHYGYLYMKKIIDIINNYKNFYINKINDVHVFLTNSKTEKKKIWMSDIALFSQQNTNKWHGNINGENIYNLVLKQEDDHCIFLHNRDKCFKICGKELYEIISDNCHKITDGEWL